MKNILRLFAVVLLLAGISDRAAGQDQKNSSTANKNLAAYYVVENAFKTGDTHEIDRVVASDFVDHTERGGMNRDSLKAMITWMHNAYPDMKSEKIRDLADDEYVMALRHYAGTSSGEPGMPPKGEKYTMKSIEVVRFKEGKAVEHWAFIEMADMLKMMSPQNGK